MVGGKHKEVELYEAFFPSAQGEGSAHAHAHETAPPSDDECTCQQCTCDMTEQVADTLNDSLGG